MNTFIFRKNYWIGLKELPPEQRLAAYDVIMEYVFDEEIKAPVFKECIPVLSMIFESVERDFERIVKR